MNKVLVYREDIKIFFLKKDSKLQLPETDIEDIKNLRGWDQQALGFNVQQIATKANNLVVVMRNFGPVKVSGVWLEIEKATKILHVTSDALSNLIGKDIKQWQKIHLDLIKQTFEKFKQAGIDIFLAGGWAADFLAGKITRPHVDIDTFVWRKDREKVKKLWENAGFIVKYKTNKQGVDKFQNEKDFSGVDNYFIEDTPKEKMKYAGSVDTSLQGINVKVVNPKALEQELKDKLEFNRKHLEFLSGPIEKTAHDLALVQEYLHSPKVLPESVA